MLCRRTRKNQSRILDEPEPAIEGWIAQEDTASRALGLQLSESGSNKRATTASALMSGRHRDGPQAEPTEGLVRNVHWRRCDVPDHFASYLGYQGNREGICLPEGQNNEMFSLVAERMVGERLPYDGIDCFGIGVPFASD